MNPTIANRQPAKVKKPVAVGKHLIADPRVCHGELTFRGTRVPVETVLIRLGKGRSVESMLQSWPELTRVAIEEAATLAAGLLAKHFKKPYRHAHEPTGAGRSGRRRRNLADAGVV